jgi:hypothetical protein
MIIYVYHLLIKFQADIYRSLDAIYVYSKIIYI